jgi:hypothetical protein
LVVVVAVVVLVQRLLFKASQQLVVVAVEEDKAAAMVVPLQDQHLQQLIHSNLAEQDLKRPVVQEQPVALQLLAVLAEVAEVVAAAAEHKTAEAAAVDLHPQVLVEQQELHKHYQVQVVQAEHSPPERGHHQQVAAAVAAEVGEQAVQLVVVHHQHLVRFLYKVLPAPLALQEKQ